MKFLLLFLLAGCAGAPETKDGAQCSPVFKYTEDNKYISIEESFCVCRLYHFGLDYVGQVKNTDSWIEPIQSCDRLVGWSPQEYAKKAAYWEAVRAYIKDRSNNGKPRNSSSNTPR
jgi:hypothetical protein